MATRRFIPAALCVLLAATMLFAQTTSQKNVLTVVSPNGGEVWLNGSTQMIQWKYEGADVRAFTIHLSSDAGKTYNPIMTGIPGTARESKWMVKASDSQTCLIKVVGEIPPGNPMLPAFISVEDASDRPFTIVTKEAPPPPVIEGMTVLSPKAGETWINGMIATVTWKLADGMPAPKFYNVYLITPGTVTQPITVAKEVPGSQMNAKWKVSAPATTDAKIRVVAYYADRSVEAMSGVFTIKDGETTTSPK